MEYLEQAKIFAQQHDVAALALSFALGVAVMLFIPRKKRKMGVTRKQREGYINMIFNDRIGDVIEDMYYKNEVTIWERNKLYRQIAARRGKRWGTRDLCHDPICKNNPQRPKAEEITPVETPNVVVLPAEKLTLAQRIAALYPGKSRSSKAI